MTSENTMNGSYSTTPVNGVPSGLDRVVGTRVFEDVLYSGAYVDRVTPDGLFAGERALEIEQNVETVRSIGIDEPDQVLAPRGPVTLTGGYPFHAVVFLDQMVVRGRQLLHTRGPPEFANDGYALE